MEMWKVTIVLLITINWPQETRLNSIDFECPAPQAIDPCSCREENIFSGIHCEGVQSLNTIQRALGHQSPLPIPWLYITNSNLFDLPPGAFYNISVSRLFISGSNLRYVAEDAFVGLENLAMLVLQYDRLFRVPSNSWPPLGRLKTLSLASNFILRVERGAFEELPALESLILTGNRISHIDKGAFPPTVKFLSLASNHLMRLNGSVQNLPNLERLFLTDNDIINLDGELGGLTKLKMLDASQNVIKTLGSDTFVDLSSLTNLDLGNNNLESVGDSLHPLANLTHLSLSNNYLDVLLENSFRNPTALQVLDLSGNRVTAVDLSLRHLSNLRKLNLTRNRLVTLKHVELKWLRRLRVLDLSHNELTVLKLSGQDLGMLTVLKLAGNRIKSFSFNLNSLTELDISFNDLRTFSSRDLGNKLGLRVLNLEGNPWTCNGHLTDTFRELTNRQVSIRGIPVCPLPAN
ncbi:uncharacterized protein LOC143243824 [Tachypleus tridentatus]|uniref:uncharacterized protein LOC143243824 n=1 Tax=Tachypleus tridentatus TaxID=6853 RepID=UPI003FD32D77